MEIRRPGSLRAPPASAACSIARLRRMLCTMSDPVSQEPELREPDRVEGLVRVTELEDEISALAGKHVNFG